MRRPSAVGAAERGAGEQRSGVEGHRRRGEAPATRGGLRHRKCPRSAAGGLAGARLAPLATRCCAARQGRSARSAEMGERGAPVPRGGARGRLDGAAARGSIGLAWRGASDGGARGVEHRGEIVEHRRDGAAHHTRAMRERAHAYNPERRGGAPLACGGLPGRSPAGSPAGLPGRLRGSPGRNPGRALVAARAGSTWRGEGGRGAARGRGSKGGMGGASGRSAGGLRAGEAHRHCAQHSGERPLPAGEVGAGARGARGEIDGGASDRARRRAEHGP